MGCGVGPPGALHKDHPSLPRLLWAANLRSRRASPAAHTLQPDSVPRAAMWHAFRTCYKTFTFLGTGRVLSKYLGAAPSDARKPVGAWRLPASGLFLGTSCSWGPGVKLNPRVSGSTEHRESSRQGESEPPGAQLPRKAARSPSPRGRTSRQSATVRVVVGSEPGGTGRLGSCTKPTPQVCVGLGGLGTVGAEAPQTQGPSSGGPGEGAAVHVVAVQTTTNVFKLYQREIHRT